MMKEWQSMARGQQASLVTAHCRANRRQRVVDESPSGYAIRNR